MELCRKAAAGVGCGWSWWLGQPGRTGPKGMASGTGGADWRHQAQADSVLKVQNTVPGVQGGEGGAMAGTRWREQLGNCRRWPSEKP